MIALKDKKDFLDRMEVALNDYDYNVEMHGINSHDCEEDREWLSDLCKEAIGLGWLPEKLEFAPNTPKSMIGINSPEYPEKAYWYIFNELNGLKDE